MVTLIQASVSFIVGYSNWWLIGKISNKFCNCPIKLSSKNYSLGLVQAPKILHSINIWRFVLLKIMLTVANHFIMTKQFTCKQRGKRFHQKFESVYKDFTVKIQREESNLNVSWTKLDKYSSSFNKFTRQRHFTDKCSTSMSPKNTSKCIISTIIVLQSLLYCYRIYLLLSIRECPIDRFLIFPSIIETCICNTRR